MSTARSPIDRQLGPGSSLLLPEALAASTLYPGHPTVEVHQTHASWVFLAGQHAYKVKKPVRLPFLDYSTLARRHSACWEEVRVNGELAPDIYLGVRAIVQTPDGVRFAPDGTPDAVEYAVQMCRFDEARTLHGAIRTRSLTRAQVREVARFLADFHRRSPTVTGGKPAQVLDAWRANVAELACLEHPGERRCTGSARRS
jgi:aminoglycoside phosphotransferase family enzyme